MTEEKLPTAAIVEKTPSSPKHIKPKHNSLSKGAELVSRRELARILASEAKKPVPIEQEALLAHLCKKLGLDKYPEAPY